MYPNFVLLPVIPYFFLIPTLSPRKTTKQSKQKSKQKQEKPAKKIKPKQSRKTKQTNKKTQQNLAFLFLHHLFNHPPGLEDFRVWYSMPLCPTILT